MRRLSQKCLRSNANLTRIRTNSMMPYAVLLTANITAAQSEKLVYTAFMHGLRTNPHMHSWVTRRELSRNIESALILAEPYEKEYGWQSSSQANGVTVNARIIASRSNRPANRSQDVCQKAVRDVNGENSALLGAQMSSDLVNCNGSLPRDFLDSITV